MTLAKTLAQVRLDPEAHHGDSGVEHEHAPPQALAPPAARSSSVPSVLNPTQKKEIARPIEGHAADHVSQRRTEPDHN